MCKPEAYISGFVEFYNLDIEVNPSVLIPRLESELLVEHALKRIPKGGKSVLDLCCGSGALGLALKKERPDLRVVLSDISEEALEVAQKNGKRNGLCVEFLLSDLVSAMDKTEKFDFVICNPPYISNSEYQDLEPSVRLFEPKLALVGGEDGLLFYRRIQEELPPFIQQKGKIFFEIGKDLGKSVREIFTTPQWGRCELLQDYASLDRFFIVERI